MIKIVNLKASKSIFGSNAELLKKITVVSLGESNITKGTCEALNISTAQNKALTGFTKKVVDTFFKYADNEYIQVLELGATGATPDTLPEQITRIGTLLDNNSFSSYMVIVPEGMWKDTSFATLVSKYNDVNKMVYFVGVVPFSYNTSTAAEVKRLANMKSVIMIFDQLKDSTNTSVAGVFAGTYINKFMISLTNTMKSFDYIFINDNIKTIDKTKSDELITNNIVFFADIIGKPGFYNVKCSDGEKFDYYISFDNINIRIVDALQNVLVNSNNELNGALRFDNNSILLLKSVIETELSVGKTLKLITEFGSGYNKASKSITGIGEIAYLPLQEYIESEEAAYNEGEYNSFNMTVRISRWILKVALACNLK